MGPRDLDLTPPLTLSILGLFWAYFRHDFETYVFTNILYYNTCMSSRLLQEHHMAVLQYQYLHQAHRFKPLCADKLLRKKSPCQELERTTIYALLALISC